MFTAVLNTKVIEIGNKIPDTSIWIKKTDCNTKITEINSTSHKTRQVHTKTELKEHITFNKTNR